MAIVAALWNERGYHNHWNGCRDQKKAMVQGETMQHQKMNSACSHSSAKSASVAKG